MPINAVSCLFASLLIVTNLGCEQRIAKTKKAQQQLKALGMGIDAYYQDFRDYPSSLATLTKPFRARNGKVYGPYILEGLSDPWGNAWTYRKSESDVTSPSVGSLGPDGKSGTGDDLIEKVKPFGK